MNCRTILAILTGGATVLYSRFASAGNSDPNSPIPSWSALRLNGKAGRASTKFPDLKSVGTDRQVRSIAYSRGAYSRDHGRRRDWLISWKALSASKSIRAISGLASERRSFCRREPKATDFGCSSPCPLRLAVLSTMRDLVPVAIEFCINEPAPLFAIRGAESQPLITARRCISPNDHQRQHDDADEPEKAHSPSFRAP